MRKQFCDALVERSINPKMVFLTGDLGFMALEPLQKAMKEKFINAGISEQNMVSVAAAMAKEGLEPWVYSIAPFCYARPFEQIRNDVTFHNLPVKIIGNGGGYGYGVMGPTHHAIEDYGILLTLPNMRVFIPVFDEDLTAVIERAGDLHNPVYLRLGRGEIPAGYTVPIYSPWRQLVKGNGMVVIVAGPLAGTYISSFLDLPLEKRPNFWVVSELPIEHNPLPTELVTQMANSKNGICVIEEHVQRGSLGSELALLILEQNMEVSKFQHLYARSHHYPTYGSQTFLRNKSGLDAKTVLSIVAPNFKENN